MVEQETMEYDIVIVGGGPAGLAAAIRAAQLAQQFQRQLTLCIIEKAPAIGAHTLSGCIMDPRALTELLPNWRALGAPLAQPVVADRFLFLSRDGARETPHWLLPPCFRNEGNYVVRLGHVVRWLGEQAGALGVDVFAGYAAARVLYDDAGAVCGVETGKRGVARDGSHTPGYQAGTRVLGRYTLFAEGSRGHLGRQLIERFHLDAACDPQSYAIGVKELWEVDPARAHPGLVIHTAGWPLDADTYGGSFLYHLADNLVAVGFVIGTDYRNPSLSPFDELQRYKTHPCIRPTFEHGRRVAYGARALTAGGLTALPRLVFPGGALIGCDAGTMNAARIKGSHAAIKSGMLAAEAAVDAVLSGRNHDRLEAYPRALRESWLYTELRASRNFKQWFHYGRRVGTLMTGVEQWLLRGHVPWTLHHRTPDYARLQRADACTKIQYPKPGGKLTFDRASSVFLSNTHHDENQPIHLTLKDRSVAVNVNFRDFGGPEAFYCPAGVYEFVYDPDGKVRLQINAANCLHCKLCDIKDPTQNIVWVPPQGGEGPIYNGM